MSDSTPLHVPVLLDSLLSGVALEAPLVEALFGRILDGALSPVQVGALLVALRAKGETPQEIAAAARALRSRAHNIDAGLPAGTVVLDTCGTGGDGASTVNLSTLTALLVAACGVVVAKHGNRAITSRAGSADILEALGIAVDGPAPEHDQRLVRSLREVGIAFFFAPRHHAALKKAAAVRGELGVRTVFNVLGPLANPAGATHQLLGVFDDRRRSVLARVLAELGTRRAWVVHGLPCPGAPRGLDEISPCGPSRITELRPDGSCVERELSPQDVGFEPVPLAALQGASGADNAKIALRLLDGERGPVRDAVVLNAACALHVAERASDLREGRAMAEDALDSGRAKSLLDRWVACMKGTP